MCVREAITHARAACVFRDENQVGPDDQLPIHLVKNQSINQSINKSRRIYFSSVE